MSTKSNRRWCCASRNPSPGSRSPKSRRRRRRRYYPKRLRWRELHSILIQAKAGIHLSTVRAADQWIPAFAGMTVLRSTEGEVDDLVRFVAARGRDLDAVALALADEGARQGRGHREPTVFDVALVLADDPERLLLFRFLS